MDNLSLESVLDTFLELKREAGEFALTANKACAAPATVNKYTICKSHCVNHGKAQILGNFPPCKPGDRPEVIIEFARGGRSDGLPVTASVFFLPFPANYLCA